MAKPEIRLKGFEGEWMYTPLGCLFNERNESDIHGEMLSVTMNKGIIRASENGLYDNSNSDKSHYKLVKVGDIAYNSMRMWQGASGCSNYEGIVSPAYTVIKPCEGVFTPFFACLFKNRKVINIFRLHSQGLTSDSWNLKFPAFSKIKVSYPSNLDEQKAIAGYLKSIDSVILATEKKIESLKQIKSASLISMFPQAGESTPRVRFKGFEGEWRNVMLEECLEVCKDRNFNEQYDRNDVLSVSDDFGVVNQIRLLGRSYAGKSVANYRLLKTGDIVYTKSPLKIKPFGIIKVNEGPTGIVSTLYAVYTPKKGVYPQYINYYFEPSYRMNRYIHPLVNKGAKNDMKVSDENVLKGFITIPSNIKEQQRIADYFRSLDKQISLQEQRLEKLKQIKAACLDKMFV